MRRNPEDRPPKRVSQERIAYLRSMIDDPETSFNDRVSYITKLGVLERRAREVGYQPSTGVKPAGYQSPAKKDLTRSNDFGEDR